jgi:hypothetical protein
MNVVDEYQDVLMGIEATTVSFYRQNDKMLDANVLFIYEKLLSHFDRSRRGLPDLPPNIPVSLVEFYTAQLVVCKEIMQLKGLKPGVMVLILKRLIDSVKNWSKRNGVRGYLNFVDEFIK